MNLLKKASLATLTFFGMSFAGNLWGPDPDEFPSLQVKVPDAVTCWESGLGDDCYTTTAGWWFGYTDQDAETQVKMGGSYTAFATGVSITDETDGSSLIDEDALRVKFRAGPPLSDEAPTIAGIGFNFKEPEDQDQVITGYNGYCISYTSTGAVQFELGWFEMPESGGYGYDTWYVPLPANTTVTTIDLPWSDFEKDGWGKDLQNQPLATATDQARSLKIRLKNTESAEKNVDFALYELGWLGSCDGTPIQNVAKSVVSPFSLNGRMLSTSKATSAQVINMQGAVVASLENGNQLDLSNVPTGIYLVRAAKLGISQKIVIK